MNIKQIEKELHHEDYNFLRENKHLKNRICLLTLGGSYAYGTNIESSDLDIRGVALETPKEILGVQENFNQIVETKTDTTIYSFNKMIKLLKNCNPNILEILGCTEEQYIIKNEIGQMIIDNTDIFLTQKVINSFGGYANSQLRRLQNSIARGVYNKNDKEQHILDSIKNQMSNFNDRYCDFNVDYNKQKIILSLEKSQKVDYEKEICLNINLNKYPLRDFKSILAEMNNVIRDYDKLNHRNKKKDDNHLNKHAMHLIRLYLMGIDILNGKGIITNRKNDLDLLMAIRNGEFQKSDSSYKNSFFTMLENIKKDFDYAIKNTKLPKNIDENKLEKFLMCVYQKILEGNI